ncbi:conserved phage C-terminal domain-containing protein [Bacillus sp. FJAT-49732]|uniref:Conserved phage C-terminal domain-containing protein n=1 Tax=Lederbergia citrisecunda TaxID=2833583 RepID=A0A942TMY5_9BACI|nr:conserved phage C-terminal domain-containing protein [Lederbergia citrisecunda]
MYILKKSYYAIIPANVRYDQEITPNAKLLYGEITALCNEKGYCWASNSYFADLYGVSKVSISKWINQLVDNGYLTSEIQYKDGSKEIFNRYLRIVNVPIKEKFNTPIKDKFKDNNTVINNTTNNTLDIPFVEIVTYLNDVANTNYRHATKKTKDLIKARWNEGFRLNDFKTVIDIKTKEWLSDNKMNMYLRPETLFGTKFESYLNQKGGVKTETDQYSNLF